VRKTVYFRCGAGGFAKRGAGVCLMGPGVGGGLGSRGEFFPAEKCGEGDGGEGEEEDGDEDKGEEDDLEVADEVFGCGVFRAGFCGECGGEVFMGVLP